MFFLIKPKFIIFFNNHKLPKSGQKMPSVYKQWPKCRIIFGTSTIFKQYHESFFKVTIHDFKKVTCGNPEHCWTKKISEFFLLCAMLCRQTDDKLIRGTDPIKTKFSQKALKSGD